MKTTKTIIATAVLAALSTSVFAVDATVSAEAAASVSTFAQSTGNGFASQEAVAGSFNSAYAGSHNLGTETTGHLTLKPFSWSASYGQQTDGVVYTGTEGGTYSKIIGKNYGDAEGEAAAVATQQAEAAANVELSNEYATGSLSSDSSIASSSTAHNLNNGYVKNSTDVSANNLTSGSIGGSQYLAGKSFLYIPYKTTSDVTTTNLTTNSSGLATSVSKEIVWKASSLTGGAALQHGSGTLANQ